MATSLVPPPLPSPSPPAPPSQQEQETFIEQKLGVARRWVWWVELLTLVVAWAAGVLGLLLLAALVDHGIGLGTTGRILFWMLLLAGSLYVLVMHGGPLLVRRINPLYAARTIEEARPSLKNSLINFLLLRRERAAVKEIIFQAVQQKAATDLVDVPVEATIDRSRLIYAGYVLCGVMAAVAAYKILSPKDPFTTAARVLAPWADIPRPSRVQILHVEPGSAEVYRGQTVKVVATLHGVRPKDSLRVLFSTVDGQMVDQPVELTHTVGDRYEAVLPPASAVAGFSEGMAQDAMYRIVAGDAESPSYRLTVVAAPRIIVRRLEYTFPAYTRKAPQVVAESGDIRALEGTRVALVAQANQPIRSAWIEFDPAGGSVTQTLPLQAEGHEARGQFVLQLRDDRQTPWHTSYQLRFIDQRGGRSQQPIVHRIEVLRDLPPEVELLQPRATRVEVPEDGAVTIEVRGIDPDFGLARLYLEGQAAGRPPFTIDLLPADADQPPQAVVPIVFQPRSHGLRAGDEMTWVAVAEDHRMHPVSGQPEPNVARSPVQTLVVLPPQSPGGQPGDRDAATPPGASQKNGAASRQADHPSQTRSGEDRSQRDAPMRDASNDRSEQRRDSSSSSSPSDQPPKRDADSASTKPQGSKQPDSSKSPQQDPMGNTGSSDGEKGAGAAGQKGSSGKGEMSDAPPQGESGQPPSGNTPGAAGGNPPSSQPGERNHGQASDQPPGRGPLGTDRGNQASSGNQASGSDPGGGSSQSAKPDPEKNPSSDLPPEGQVERVEPGQTGRGKAHDGQAIEEFLKELQRRGIKIPPGQDSPPDDATGQGERGETASGDRAGGPGKSTGEKGDPGTPAKSPQGQAPQATQRGADSDQASPSSPRVQNQPQEHGQPDKNEEKDGPAGSSSPPQTPRGDSSTGNVPPASENLSKDSNAKGSGSGKEGREGAGTTSREAQGSAGKGVRENKDVPKTPQPPDGKAEEGEPSPESNSKRQSNSRGGQSGDESGGGKAGAGQPSEQPGRDSAGSQTPSDEGAGVAREPGSGEVGSQGGQGPTAGGKTGVEGQQAGQGTSSRPQEPSSSPEVGKSAGEAGDPKSDAARPQGDGQPGQPGTAASDAPVGGSDGGRPRFQTPNRSGVDPEADRANLEYARRATELVLSHLKDEAHRPDPELLKRLGWTPEDLAEFVRRWEALSRAAEEAPAGKRELDEALRSLGLRDPALRKRSGGNASDQQRDLRDAGNRSSPPPAYRELFDAFRKGAARASGRP